MGTALQAEASSIRFLGSNQFIQNTGREGGAISLLKSRLHLDQSSTTTLKSNKADYGGGLFATPIRDENTQTLTCSLSLSQYNKYYELDISFSFTNNSALYGGNSIFYGIFTQCFVIDFRPCTGLYFRLSSRY